MAGGATFDGYWTFNLLGSNVTSMASMAPMAGPLLANGRIAFAPFAPPTSGASFSAPLMVDSTRSCLALSIDSGAGDAAAETFHFCGLRVLEAADSTDAPVSQPALSSASLDTRTGTLHASFSGPLADVHVAMRALRHMPDFAMLSVDVSTRSSNCVLVHELSAKRGLAPPTFSSELLALSSTAGSGSNAPLFVVSGAAAGTTRPDSTVHHAVSCAYLLEQPASARIEGFNVYRADPQSCYTRIAVPAGASNVRVHALCAVAATATSSDEALKRTMLALLATAAGPARSASTAASNIAAAHSNAWAATWRTDVAATLKAGLSNADLLVARQQQGALRYAMYNLHSSARPGSVVDLAGSLGVGMGELHALPALLFLCPEAARSVLAARHAQLPSALRAAHARGLRGALFPFDARVVGGDAAGGGGRWTSEAALRLHNTALVGVNAWDFYRATLDPAWLQERGYPILRAVADMLASAATPGAQPGVFTLRDAIALDDGPPTQIGTTDNALTVCCAQLALRGAIEASYELRLAPPPAWRAALEGLSVPMTAGAVVRFNAEDGRAPGGTTTVREPLAALAPQLNRLLFSASSGRDLPTALAANLAHWAPRLPVHPLDNALQTMALAQLTQTDRARLPDFMASLATQPATGPFGNLTPAGARDAANDAMLSAAAVLLPVLQGLAGARVTGGVGETRFYYEPFGIQVAGSAVLPPGWDRLQLSGIGPAARSITTLNQLVHTDATGGAGANLNSSPAPGGGATLIAPWTLDTLR